MIDWTDTVPTEPGVYLWKRKSDAVRRASFVVLKRDMIGLPGERKPVGMLRAVSGYKHRWGPRLMRGQWIGPIGEGK